MDEKGVPRPSRARHDGGWRRTSSRHLFRSHWYGLRQDELLLPGGEPATYTVVEHPGYVMVLPLRADGTAIMERVYRHTLQATLLECPAGGMDGEAPEVAAARELEEETGWRAGRYVPLGRYAGSSGISSEEFELFIALGLTRDGTVCREPTEQIELEEIPIEALYARVLEGEVFDAPSSLCILLGREWWCRHGPGTD